MGMVAAMSGVAVLAYQDLTFNKIIPPWCFVYMAFSAFMYQTFDAVDGLHARALKASSPLGQLFDHGIDALLHGALLCTQMEALKLGSSLLSFFYFQGLFVFLYVYIRKS